MEITITIKGASLAEIRETCKKIANQEPVGICRQEPAPIKAEKVDMENHGHTWTIADDTYLISYYYAYKERKMSSEDIAQKMGRTWKACTQRMRTLGYRFRT